MNWPIRAIWRGDSDVLQNGSEVEVLASDPAGRFGRDGTQEVPARTACWIRHWPARKDYPQYRSCDLCDLEVCENAGNMIAGDA
jgi:hypothetical protein